MGKYIDKTELYKEISLLEKSARQNYLDSNGNDIERANYLAKMTELTTIKHLIADFPCIIL